MQTQWKFIWQKPLKRNFFANIPVKAPNATVNLSSLYAFRMLIWNPICFYEIAEILGSNIQYQEITNNNKRNYFFAKYAL